VLDHLTKGRDLCRVRPAAIRIAGSNVLGQQSTMVTGLRRWTARRSINHKPQGLRGDAFKVIKKGRGPEEVLRTTTARVLQGGALSLQGGHHPLAGARMGRGTYGPRPGEVDEPRASSAKICVVPKPYQQPHPPLFPSPSSGEAKSTIRYTAQFEYRAVDPGVQSARLPSACAGNLPGRWRPAPAAKLGLERGASAPSAPSHFGPHRGPTPVELLRTDETTPAFKPLFRRAFGFWEAFRTPRGCPKISDGSLHAGCRPPSGRSSGMRNVKYGAGRDARPGEGARDRGAAQNKSATGELRMGSAGFFDQGFMSLDGRKMRPDGGRSPSTSFRRFTDHGSKGGFDAGPQP